MPPALSPGRLLEVYGDIHPKMDDCPRQNPAYRLAPHFGCKQAAFPPGRMPSPLSSFLGLSSLYNLMI